MPGAGSAQLNLVQVTDLPSSPNGIALSWALPAKPGEDLAEDVAALGTCQPS